ncbi:MAG: asparagine synthase (glutamine-hydrolyzing) [Desulfovibrionaceae bacterium]|nr:asparagine synthase (glutamine-hydrolyzing) [Desulfovibrionaceae bacterium]
MCGIAGVYALDGQNLDPDERNHVAHMLDCLKHRGPDAQGILLQDAMCFGHQRLSIIDLESGSQPMSTMDLSITYNGEIYNYQSLRRQLEPLGANFRTNSDTEVILWAFHFYGQDCVKYFEGMFAFAIYDKASRKLFLARDRFGKKPLFYTLQQGKCYFASELSALINLKHLNFKLSPASIARFLSYEYVPGPQTLFCEIAQVLPSHTLTIQKQGLYQRRYWDLPAPEANKRKVPDLANELLQLLQEAVSKRRISDVPLGVFLSGGLDSSIVTALMAKESIKPVPTFSIGFREASFDESKYARLVAQYFGTEHHEEILEANVCAELLPQIISHMDVPMADASVAPTYLLSRLARRHVTVALGGDGSDELFAGYENYAAIRFAELYLRFPKFLQGLIEYLARYLPKSSGYVNLNLAMQTFLNGAKTPPALRLQRLLSAFWPTELKKILSQEFQERLEHNALEPEKLLSPTSLEYHQWQTQVSPLARAFYVYVRQYLPEDILVKVDRCSMLNSLEVRAPFLDTKLAEFVARLPLNYKISGLKGKWLLRKAVAKILPKAILHRNKRGFQIPVAAWLRHELLPLTQELLDPKKLKEQGIFNSAVVSDLLQKHVRHAQDLRKPLWTLLVLQLWLHAHHAPSF